MKRLFLRNQLCIPVKGHNRTIIYDLLRRDYFFVSNEHHAILDTDDFIAFHKIDDEEARNELINFLLWEEIIFEVTDRSQKKRFIALNRNFEPANRITHVVIHADIPLSFFDLIDEEYILNLSIITKKEVDAPLIRLLQKINALEIDSVYLYVEDQDSFNLEPSLRMLSNQNLVFSVNIFNAKNFTKKTELYEQIFVNFFEDSLSGYQTNLTEDKLGINIERFFEAYNFHSYYHGKVYIDQNGHIKNGLNNLESFGHVSTCNKENFINIISSGAFAELGNINKNDTLVCKDCEFRYMCVDNRVPIKGSHQWYHSTECNYNPYLSKWNNEKGYLSLIACGVFLSAAGCSIEEKKLNEKFNSAWSA